MGILADRYSRKWLLVTACVVWSAMQYAAGYFESFAVFVAMRVGQGVTMSVCNPAAFSLIRDYFPPENRSTANSIYSSGIYVG
jgi:MFS family permease